MRENEQERKTLRDWLQYGEQYLRERGVADASVDAWLLLEYAASITRSFYYLHMKDEMDSVDAREYRKLLEQRGRHIPLQHLTGEAWFYGYRFLVNQDVLIPRQDTETLVEEACRRIWPGMHILDLCTGSGCILISILKQKSVTGIGSDISEEALEVARHNARRLNVKASFVQSDLFENIGGTFDMILSNPPYIPSRVIDTLEQEVKDHEPHLALDGHEDGLYFYQKIIPEALLHLPPEGWLCLEIGYDQADPVKNLLEKYQYQNVKIIKDPGGNDRVALGQKTEQGGM